MPSAYMYKPLLGCKMVPVNNSNNKLPYLNSYSIIRDSEIQTFKFEILHVYRQLTLAKSAAGWSILRGLSHIFAVKYWSKSGQNIPLMKDRHPSKHCVMGHCWSYNGPIKAETGYHWPIAPMFIGMLSTLLFPVTIGKQHARVSADASCTVNDCSRRSTAQYIVMRMNSAPAMQPLGRSVSDQILNWQNPRPDGQFRADWMVNFAWIVSYICCQILVKIRGRLQSQHTFNERSPCCQH